MQTSLVRALERVRNEESPAGLAIASSLALSRNLFPADRPLEAGDFRDLERRFACDYVETGQ